DHYRHGRPGRLPDDGRAWPIREPAVRALRRPAVSLARLRLADPGQSRDRGYADLGACTVSELPVEPDDVRRAAAAIAGSVDKTPLVPAPWLSDATGSAVWLKLETQHPTGSFKERGALNKLLTLNENERGTGVVAMSAGNHAQGVAYHARRLGVPATIVMPEGTPFTKIDRTESLGATVMLQGDNLVAARRAADKLARERNLIPVHPYDDPAVIAGQGTIALQMVAAQPDPDTLLLPV